MGLNISNYEKVYWYKGHYGRAYDYDRSIDSAC